MRLSLESMASDSIREKSFLRYLIENIGYIQSCESLGYGNACSSIREKLESIGISIKHRIMKSLEQTRIYYSNRRSQEEAKTATKLLDYFRNNYLVIK